MGADVRGSTALEQQQGKDRGDCILSYILRRGMVHKRKRWAGTNLCEVDKIISSKV